MQELVRKYIAGSYVFREGEAGDYAFIVYTGKVRLFRVQGPREIQLDELLEGRLFGEAALVERATRKSHAVAITGSECYAIDRRVYLARLAKIDPAQARALRNLHVFIHRVPLYDAQGKRVVGVASVDVERTVGAVLDSDFGAGLAKTGDPLVDLVAEQVLIEAKRRLPAPAEDPETTKMRERLKPKASAANPSP